MVEEHNLKNLGCSVRESIRRYEPIIMDAKDSGIRVVLYLSAAFGYHNTSNNTLIRPEPGMVNAYIDKMIDAGVIRVTLTDLQGVADEKWTCHVWEEVLKHRNEEQIRIFGYHPHHISPEKAVHNSISVAKLGISNFDASIGGRGGCITGAPGNQPSELLVYQLRKHGFITGINEKRLLSLSEKVNKSLYNRIPLTSFK